MSVYLVNLPGREIPVVFDESGAAAVENVDKPITIHRVNERSYLVCVGASTFNVVVQPNGGTYDVLLGNNQEKVSVETEREQLIKRYAMTGAADNRFYEIHAPMPALVVRVEVAVGEEVREGQGLLILEAMKMENEIRSHQVGRVKEILVTNGKAVDKGELLMVLEE